MPARDASGHDRVAPQPRRQNGAVPRRVLLLLFGALVLVGCRLDVDVAVVVGPDGTGVVTVTAVANDSFVAQFPDLAEALVLDDAIARGWSVDGPEETDSGGLRIVLTREVSGPQDLANALASIGPPLLEPRAGRTTEDDQTTSAVDATLQLPDGFASFADADLIAAVGGVPWQSRLDAAGATPSEDLSFTFRLSLPGEVTASTGTEVSPGVYEWVAPMDGTTVSVAHSTLQRPPESGAWARPVAIAALVALVVWIVISIVLIAAVIRAQRRRARRRRTPPARGAARPPR